MQKTPTIPMSASPGRGMLLSSQDSEKLEEMLQSSNRKQQQQSIANEGEMNEPVHYSLNLLTNEFDYVGLPSIAVLGFSTKQLKEIGISGFEERIHPDDLRRITEDFTQNHHTDDIIPQIQYRFKSNDGRYRWICEKRRVIYDNNRMPNAIVGTWSDVTARMGQMQAAI
jgi:PAS domain-containing protein